MRFCSNLLICDATDPTSSRVIEEVRRTLKLHPDEVPGMEQRQFGHVFVNIGFGRLEGVSLVSKKLAKLVAADITVLVDSGHNARWQVVQANSLHAKNVMKRPAARDQVLALLALDDRERGIDPLPPGIGRAAAALANAFSAVLRDAPIELRELLSTSQNVLEEISEVGSGRWLDEVRLHHEGTFQHCLLVTGAAAALAHQLDLPNREKLELVSCALIHDIGKAKIPLSILNKPGPLTEDERILMQLHPSFAMEYLRRGSQVPGHIIDGVLHHHELMDGSGYPDSLRGDQISNMTKMVTVCDIYGALIEERSYKPAKSAGAAVAILSDMAGQGKLDYALVAQMAEAVGIAFPKTPLHFGR